MNGKLSKRLQIAMEQVGIKQPALEKLSGVPQQTISNILNEVVKKSLAVNELASALAVNPLWLSGNIGLDTEIIKSENKDLINNQLHLSNLHASVSRVTVRGHVQAGIWQEAIEWPPEEFYSMPAPALDDYSPDDLYGLLVKGDSMDKEYKGGSFLICTSIFNFKRPLKNGDHVIVERQHAGKYEATVKEIELDQAGRILLWPRSNNPDYQAPFIIKYVQDANIENDIITRISGVVLFSLQRRF